MFTRPHLAATESHVDLHVALAAIRALPSYEAFLEALDEELNVVYDGKVRRSAEEAILYACGGAGQALSFGNHWNLRAFELLKTYDESHAAALVLRKTYDDMMAARPVPVKPEPKLDENGDEIPPPPKSKKALREEAEQRKKDVEQLRVVLSTEHKAECAAIKLKNVFALATLRVPIATS